ncbi:MAG: isoprenylcysteine carboxylmethyltransferase family protein [Alphaproteobacteria bacterium]|nr:isoprenylcysteine carboxylmethyltransferase family protein [Alphaproteobacteria bacterium]
METATNTLEYTENAKQKSMWDWMSNLALAFCYFFFVTVNLIVLLTEFRYSILLLLIFNTAILILAIIRRTPNIFSVSPYDWVITMIGTFSPLLLIGAEGGSDSYVLIALQSFGVLISFAGLMSLNRSFGLVPANRGIVSTGMYSIVRHPLYTGYIISISSFVLQNLSLHNAIFFTLFVAFESLRLLAEERFLSQDAEYVEYMKKTRWRVVLPFIW